MLLQEKAAAKCAGVSVADTPPQKEDDGAKLDLDNRQAASDGAVSADDATGWKIDRTSGLQAAGVDSTSATATPDVAGKKRKSAEVKSSKSKKKKKKKKRKKESK